MLLFVHVLQQENPRNNFTVAASQPKKLLELHDDLTIVTLVIRALCFPSKPFDLEPESPSANLPRSFTNLLKPACRLEPAPRRPQGCVVLPTTRLPIVVPGS